MGATGQAHGQLLENLDMLVGDEQKVVSFKWLSRAFSIPSDTAKEVLKAFVDKKKDAVKAVYLVSGWTRDEPRAFSVQLVGTGKLEGTLASLDESSSHVYSVQPSIPKDPAALWTPDFVQAEELFNRPPEEDNCLRDNSFSSVALAEVHRNPGGRRRVVLAPPEAAPKQGAPKGVAEKLPRAATPPASAALEQDAPKETGAKTANIGTTPKVVAPAGGKGTKAKGAPAKGGLANLWGKAPPPKAKHAPAKAEEKTAGGAGAGGGDAEARIRAMEEAEGQSSEEDEEELAPRGRGGRRRRVALEDDEEGEDDDQGAGAREGAGNGDVEMEEAEGADDGADVIMRESEEQNGAELDEAEEMDAVDLNEMTPPKEQPKERVKESEPEVKPPSAAVGIRAGTVGAPKRRKVTRSTIDDRGREVIEVVWEDELEKAGGSGDASMAPEAVKVEERAPSPPKPAPKKVAAKEAEKPKAAAKKAAPTAKGGKKGAQGNIMSFFKKK